MYFDRAVPLHKICLPETFTLQVKNELRLLRNGFKPNLSISLETLTRYNRIQTIFVMLYCYHNI